MESESSSTTSNRDKGVKKSKYLVFKLGEERFGMVLSQVKEVIGLAEITAVPQVPKFFKGLINLRGKIISVVDLRVKLSMPETPYEAKKTSVVIVDMHDFVMGIIVDDVEEVASYDHEQIETHVEVQSKISEEYIQGIAKTHNSKLVLLIDIASILDHGERELIRQSRAS